MVDLPTGFDYVSEVTLPTATTYLFQANECKQAIEQIFGAVLNNYNSFVASNFLDKKK